MGSWRVYRGILRFVARAGMAASCGLLCMPQAGCDDDGLFCTSESVPGIVVEVRDAATGAPAACGATAWLISGSWSEVRVADWGCDLPDSLQSPYLQGAYERRGVYTVLIIKDGYAPWSHSGIEVLGDRCHVRTVKLKAMLVGNPSADVSGGIPIFASVACSHLNQLIGHEL